MWAHLTNKQKNRTSSGYENLTAEEGQVLSRWDALKEPPADPPLKQEDPQVKHEVVKEEPQLDAPQTKEKQPMQVQEKLSMEAPELVSSSSLDMSAVMYHPGDGSLEQVTLQPGEDGFMVALSVKSGHVV